ncbi:PilZ domain-containing protein [Methylobacterium sp. A54F]
MTDRRAAARRTVTEEAVILIDAHTALPCRVHDHSEQGVRLTLAEAGRVPEAFVLWAPCLREIQICRIAWRSGETIGAWFDDAAAH